MFAILVMGMGTLLASGTKDDFTNTCFTVESLADNNTVTFSIPAGVTAPLMALVSYSTDGTNWTTVEVDATDQVISVVLNQGETVRFKGVGVQCCMDPSAFCNIVGTADHIVYGNIMSLLYDDDFALQDQLPADSYYNFGLLFSGNSHLVSAEDLVLPAETLTQFCYFGMFMECPALTTAPRSLPAKTLEPNCYYGMFRLCTSLTTPPALPAVDLAPFCYGFMFESCSSLTRTPELPAPTLVLYSYAYMFANCSSLVEVTCLATDIFVAGCTEDWLNGVADNGIFYKDPDMIDWEPDSPSGIPTGWTVADYDMVDEQQEQVVAYPNPVVDRLHVTGTDLQSVRVFDMQGRLVHAELCDHADQVEVDFRGFAKGVYTVSIQSEGRVVTRSILR